MRSHDDDEVSIRPFFTADGVKEPSSDAATYLARLLATASPSTRAPPLMDEHHARASAITPDQRTGGEGVGAIVGAGAGVGDF